MIHCNSDTPEEMHHWISLLQKPKGDARIDGQEFLVRGENEFTNTSYFLPLFLPIYFLFSLAKISCIDFRWYYILKVLLIF